MGYKLNNGDQVQVVTSKNQKPTEDWLKMVVTGKARSKIRSAMKDEKRKVGEYGKEALERKLKNLRVDFEENVDNIAKHMGYRSRVDLYYALSQDDARLSDLKNYTIENGRIIFRREEDEHESRTAPIAEELKKIQRPSKANRSNILVNGEPADMYQFSLATCCNPVQGDDIFAYLSAKEGLKIHRTHAAMPPTSWPTTDTESLKPTGKKTSTQILSWSYSLKGSTPAEESFSPLPMNSP